MIVKYLPICLFALSTARAQTTLTSPELMNPIVPTEEVQPIAPDLSLHASSPVSAAASAPFYSNGESRAHFFAHTEIGLYNRTMATYGNIKATGGGSRFGIDMGAQFMLPSRHDGDNMASASLGISWISLNDNYGSKGRIDSRDNNYFLACIRMPLMLTTTRYLSDNGKGIYFQGGVNVEYTLGGEVNHGPADRQFNKIGFAPIISFGYAAMYEYTSRYGNGGEFNLILGPFVSYNAMNVLNISGASLRYLTFGITYTAIKF